MNDSIFEISTSGVDVEQIVKEVRATAEQKMKDGIYSDARIARAERANLANLHDEDQFLSFYLQCLRDAVYVDISDFDIYERRRGVGPLLIGLKKLIWKMLKFYTYRLWSQQNQVNGLLVTSVEGLDEKYTTRIKKLEQRIEELEKRK